MAITETMTISEFGMQYQKMRVDAATINIANANTVQAPGSAAFQPLTVTPNISFAQWLENPDALQMQSTGVAPKQVYQPQHPAADSQGFVHFANIDMAAQMVTLTEATRAYEANIKAFNAQMNMTMSALELGK